jgi:3-oxoacyl-[acyl-carrier protein] reductase
MRADVSNADETDAMVDQFLSEFGHIDILVNNAGIGITAMVDEMSVEMWDEMIAVNLRSVFLMTRKVLPHMYAQGHGKIINTASQLAYKGAPGLTHYTASKAAIVSFTRSLSLEIGERGINVNCVAPGATTTPILDGMDPDILEAIRQTIPRGRFAVVDEIAPTYVFLASSAGDHFVGQCLSPNGGDVFL